MLTDGDSGNLYREGIPVSKYEGSQLFTDGPDPATRQLKYNPTCVEMVSGERIDTPQLHHCLLIVL